MLPPIRLPFRQRAVRYRPATLLALALTLAAAAFAIAIASGARASAPRAVADPADSPGQLDLVEVAFGQADSTAVQLSMRTAAPWQASALSERTSQTLCVVLYVDRVSGPDGRLCVVPDPVTESGLLLRYTTISPGGLPTRERILAAAVKHPEPTLLQASFPPAALRLEPGRYAWQARTRSSDPPCRPAQPCTDLAPDGGPVPFRIALTTGSAAQSPCFGAASRNPSAPCRDARLRLAVVPTPSVAQLSPNFPCQVTEQAGLLSPCEFGVPRAQARRTVALLGDSHAAHWRAAFETAAQSERWRGISITRSNCPVSTNAPRKEQPARRQCQQWNAELPRWLAAHPDVDTVVVTANQDAITLVRGPSSFAFKVRGYRRALQALPASVKHVVVLRDSPASTDGALACVERARRRRRAPGPACARPRGRAVRRDAAVVAATRLRSARIETIDLTDAFCGAARCFPVIGGALVYKDAAHLTDVFSSTLGPALLRDLRRTRAFGGG